MTTTITPYRQPGTVQPHKPKLHGFILAPKPHCCNKPGFITFFLMWLVCRPVVDGSLWRCHKCGKVWKRDGNYAIVKINAWDHVSNAAWCEAGGEV